MRILTRYILFDLLKVFLFTLLSMTVFVFLVLIGKEAVENGLGLVPILRMVPYLLPQAMHFAVPGTMLLATTSVYGRVAAANEIVAVKSLGISPMVMMWPTLILATLVSLGAVALNDIAVSWGRGGVQRVILESLEEIVYGRLRTTGSFSNDKLSVTVKKVTGKKLIQPTFLLFRPGGEAPWTITADRAEIRADEQNASVQLILKNAYMKLGEAHYSDSEESVYEISLAEFGGEHGGSRSPSSYSLKEIGPSKISQKSYIAQLNQEMAADAAHAIMTGRTYELSQDVWRGKEETLFWARNKLYRLYTEPHRRWANGFSCLCFVLIGAPMAVRLRHGEFWGSFFACFLPILVVYYPLLVGCLDAAKGGDIPAQAVWMGNLVLAVWGVWLMRRVIRF